MQRVNAPGATAGNMFTNGNAALGIAATELEETWHNDVQEEICNVIEGLGGTLNGSLRNQLLTVLSTNYAKIPSGTTMVFYQASAPSGWTQIVTQNDKALRVVSATGGGAGGTHGLSSPPSTSHFHTGPSHSHDMSNHVHAGPSHYHSTAGHVLTTNEMPSHQHETTITQNVGAAFGYGGAAWLRATQADQNYYTHLTSAVGGGQAHYHGDTGSAGNGNTGLPSTNTTGANGTGNTGSNGPTAFAPLYIDVIIASRN